MQANEFDTRGDGGPETAYWDCLLGVLEHVKCGAIIKSHSGAILGTNRTALELLGWTTGEEGRGEPLRLTDSQRAFLKKWLPQASVRSQITIHHHNDRHLLMGQLPDSLPHGCTLLVLIDPDLQPRPDELKLQLIWDLTPAEARLAAEMAMGETLPNLARKLGVTHSTVRSHLASIFRKTCTSRQATLTSLLSRVAMLPDLRPNVPPVKNRARDWPHVHNDAVSSARLKAAAARATTPRRSSPYPSGERRL